MRVRKYRYFMCDFETTVYGGQTYTEVWAAACVELFARDEDVMIFGSLGELLDWMAAQKCNMVAYFHNLKFDGSFWLSYLLVERGYKQAYEKTGKGEYDVAWLPEKLMENKSFKYSISDLGQWYSIVIKINNCIIEIRDSLKLLPFSVKRIGESFKTRHRKLDMEYKGFRYAGCPISEAEREYIKNDVLVVKEALEIMYLNGHDRLTIGSCCLAEFKSLIEQSKRSADEYDELFPNVYDVPLDKQVYGCETAGDYVRKSYKGGWCYLVKGKEGRVYHGGTTADVNSLYPSMMSGESGNRYPIGLPHFWRGGVIPEEALGDDRYYFVRIKTRFYLKPGKLPFIQIKSSFLYKGTEALESSDVYDKATGRYYSSYLDADGHKHGTRVEMVLTMTDYKLVKEHYDLVDFEMMDGCWFYARVGIFDDYINKYKKIKQESDGAIRELAKLFLNNLYGKLASNRDSSFKFAYMKDDKSLGFVPVAEQGKKPGYIPAGTAVTSYARNFTIRAAQANFYGADKPGFIYADTDSIHCDLPPDEIRGIRVHDKDFCAWKLESQWDEGYFVRQKTYIEHVVADNGRDVEPYYNIKCAGMPQRCKDLFKLSMSGTADIAGHDGKEWTDEEKEFLFKDGSTIKRGLSDFRVGLKVPGKLLPKRIRGGIVLVESSYELR